MKKNIIIYCNFNLETRKLSRKSKAEDTSAFIRERDSRAREEARSLLDVIEDSQITDMDTTARRIARSLLTPEQVNELTEIDTSARAKKRASRPSTWASKDKETSRKHAKSTRRNYALEKDKAAIKWRKTLFDREQNLISSKVNAAAHHESYLTEINKSRWGRELYYEYEKYNSINTTVHAMNNAIQHTIFDPEAVKKYALLKSTEEYETMSEEHYAAYVNGIRNGYFDAPIIIDMFKSKGINASYVPPERFVQIESPFSDAFTLIVGDGTNHFTLRKFHKNGKLWCFDNATESETPTPKVTGPGIIEALRKQLENGNDNLVIVEVMIDEYLADDENAELISTRPVPFCVTYHQVDDFLNPFAPRDQPIDDSNDSFAPNNNTTNIGNDNARFRNSQRRTVGADYPIEMVNANFVKNMEKYHLMLCPICKECKIVSSNVTICARCQGKEKYDTRSYFADQNNQPRHIPAELRDYRLSFVEEQLISLVYVNQYMYDRPGGSASSKGHCISFQQDISEIATELPRLAADVPIVIVRSPTVAYAPTIDLKVRRRHIEVWLRWLKANSPIPGYRNLVISQANLDLLPVDGTIALKEIDSYDDHPLIANVGPSNQNNVDQLSQSLNDTTIDDSSQSLSDAGSIPSGQPILDPDSYDYMNPAMETGVVNMPNLELEDDIIAQSMQQMNSGQRNNNPVPPTLAQPAPPVAPIPVPPIVPIFPYPQRATEPLNEYNTPYLAAMAFPTLFPYGSGDPFEVNWRSNDEKFLTKVRHLINYCEIYNGKKEFRFATHSRFILWIYNINYRHRALSQGNFYLKQNSADANLTIDELKAKIAQGQNNSVIKNIQRYMANIPGTPSYWFQNNKDLGQILLDKGCCDAFITLTYADKHCPYLHRLLGIPEGSSFEVIDQYIRASPNIVNEFFTKKVKEFVTEYIVNHLQCSPEFAGWYWARYEWQFRDAIHLHGMVKFGESDFDSKIAADMCIAGHVLSLKETKTAEDLEAIEFGKEAEQALIDWHDRFVTVDATMSKAEFEVQYEKANPKPMSKKCSEVPDNEKENDILTLTYLLQRHECQMGRCLKIYNGVCQRCRFKMPKPICEKTKIEYHRDQHRDGSFGPWQLKVIQKRVNDQRITTFCKEIMYIWRANHDFSFPESMRKVMLYIVKYASKSEVKSSVFAKIYKTIFDMADAATTDTHLALKQVFTKVLGERDITRNEAIHQLLGLDLHISNVTVVKTSLDSSKGISKNQRTNQLQFNDSFVDLYSNRFTSAVYNQMYAEDQNDLNFIEFAKMFDSRKDKGDLKFRRDPQSITVRVFQQFSSNVNHIHYWKHCKYQLLRYKPWSVQHSDVLQGLFPDTEQGWKDAWHAFVITDYAKLKIPSWSEELNKSLLEATEEREGDDDEPLNMREEDDDEHVENQQDYMRVMSNRNDATSRANDYVNVLPSQVPDPNFWGRHRALYTPLEIAQMQDWIPHQIAADVTENEPIVRPLVDVASLNTEQLRAYNLIQRRMDSNTQLLLRVEGEGGTGKSHLINAICNLIPQRSYRVCAPTGRAATLIGGVTIHKLININPNVPKPELPLTSEGLRKLQDSFRGVTHIILDEFSMIGAKTLSIIESRCRQATAKNDKMFGGLNILMFGDPKQLPPVFDTPLWHTNAPSTAQTVINGLMVFKEFKLLIRLVQNHRQVDPSQVQYRGLLHRLRYGRCITDDWYILQDRIKGLAQNEAEFVDSLYLMYSKAEVHDHNMIKINHLASVDPEARVCRVDALHEGPSAQQMKSDDMMGLQPYLILSANSRVMLISNQWIKQGLTNGAMGTLRHFIFTDGAGPPNLPIAIVVEMDVGYNGPHLAGKPRHVAFNPMTAFKENDKGKTVERTQLPFILAFAITIHKCQGKYNFFLIF